MKRILFVMLWGLIVVSCEKNTENTMTLTGNIKGLKKGTLYLQQAKDSSLVVLDSLEINGDGSFTFTEEVENPDIYYLYLNKKDNNDINDRITIFGEPGLITVKTAWNTFDTKAEITGSKSQEKMEEFYDMASKFNIKELMLVQQATLPQFQNDSLALDSLQNQIDQNTIRKYRYALNFGLNNGDSYATPYLMLAEASQANPKYLDSIYKGLSPKVAESKYGKMLKELLDQN
ncbi:MAG: DUF4369 domain-containing protein [Bacteroidota bacterium]|nr:DUF4369 domain-containing protein [Bacteroidota bacterium]